MNEQIKRFIEEKGEEYVESLVSIIDLLKSVYDTTVEGLEEESEDDNYLIELTRRQFNRYESVEDYLHKQCLVTDLEYAVYIYYKENIKSLS